MNELHSGTITSSLAHKSPTIGALGAALSLAQGEFHAALKSSTNPHFKSKFADLESIWDAIREALTKHNLSITQTIEPMRYGADLVTTLIHSSGEWIESHHPMFLPDNVNPQILGSWITYARRYSLAAIVGVVQSDDDAEAAAAEMNKKASSQNTFTAKSHQRR